MDQFDLVRVYYDALNSGRIDSAAALYDDSCVAENIVPGEEGTSRGRAAAAERLRAFARDFGGGWEDGSYFRIRTIAGIGTGWGWVQADWLARARQRDGGVVRQFHGYSHFLVEDGLIRRHRTVAHEEEPESHPRPPTPSSERHYPTRPVVGVGAVVLVEESDRERIGWSEPLASSGIVLIKRRYEPLAGQWSLPGGTLELGETLEAGVAREVAEETGLVVEVGPVVEVFDRILLDADQRVRHHFVLIDYLCRPRGGRLEFGSDVSDVVVAAADALDEYALTRKAAGVIRTALRMAQV